MRKRRRSILDDIGNVTAASGVSMIGMGTMARIEGAHPRTAPIAN